MTTDDDRVARSPLIEPQAHGPRYPWRADPPGDGGQRSLPTRPGIQGRRAGLVTRGLANVLDAAVVLGLLAAAYAVVAALSFLVSPSSFRFPTPAADLVVALGGAVAALYFTVAWGAGGRTYGDAVLGLRVVNVRGRPPRWPGAALRALLCVLFPIGLLWVLVSRRNRSVQDVVLRTSVVYDWSAHV